MAKACGNCGEKVKRGFGRKAVILEDGQLRPGTICAKCFKSSVPLVTPPPTTVPTVCATPGCKRFSKFCEACMGRALDHDRELTTANTVLGKIVHGKTAEATAS